MSNQSVPQQPNNGDEATAREPEATAREPEVVARLRALADERLRTLEDERRQRDNFVSIVAHELRAPLAVLIGYAQLLVRGDGAPQAIRERASVAVLDQAKRLNTMVENLIQASRLTSGRFRAEPQRVELNELVRRVSAHQQAATPHHRLLAQLSDAPLFGNWDPALVEVVLGNLISNAVKFSPSGGDVHVAVQRKGRLAQVDITDRGIGFDALELPGLFEPYRRHARTEHYPGLGVGLFVAKGIVEAHGGQIGARSRPEEGTTFWFTLPLES